MQSAELLFLTFLIAFLFSVFFFAMAFVAYALLIVTQSATAVGVAIFGQTNYFVVG